SAGNVCSPDVCRQCGGPGQPCCSGGRCDGAGCCIGGTCVSDGATCVSGSVNYGTCAGGSCDGCGAAGLTCCPVIPPSTIPGCSEPATVGATSVYCGPGGGASQPCCAANRCLDGGCCVQTGSGTPICIVPGTACPSVTLPDAGTGGDAGSGGD